MESLVADYNARGYAGVAHFERERFNQDATVIGTLLRIAISHDDEEIFNLLLPVGRLLQATLQTLARVPDNKVSGEANQRQRIDAIG